jgi:hypothetical protein
MRLSFITLLAGSAIALGGCAYGDLGLGLGYGSGYGNYGYGNYGYGSSYYGSGYGSGYGYGPYGGYGAYPGYYGGYGSYYGWNDNYYYPGSGTYVYDSYRRPHVWSNNQRSYWTSRQQQALRNSGTRRVASTTLRPNWSGFNRAQAQQRSADRQTVRQERRASRRNRD